MDTRHTVLLDFVDHPVFVLEPDAAGIPRYVHFNAKACQGAGKVVGDVVGRTAIQVYAGRLGKVAYDHHVEVVKSGLPTAYEIQLPLADRERLVRTALRPELDDAGNTVRIYGSSNIVTDGHMFHKVTQELESISGEMEDFINLAAHDLRTPMRNVSLITEMLRDDFQDLGDGKLELIDVLETVADKALHLITDVLSYAQLTSVGEAQLQFDMQRLVADLMAVLDPMQGCVVRCAPDWVEADSTVMTLILRNLIDNSMKHAQAADGAGPLDLSISVRDMLDGFVAIDVRDNGSGISDPALLFLAGGAFRVDSGFGLLGVRRIIHARGGTLKVNNRSQNTGAVVTFTLPGRVLVGDADAA